MANANSTIEIELEIKQALDRLNRLERELQKSAQQMQKAADATGKLEGALNKAKTAAAGLFAFFSGQQIVEAADQFTNFANAVRISTSSVAEQTAVQKELYRVAQTTGSSLGDISKLYGRLRQAADQLGSSQAETIKITEIVGKALAASGTSASEASGALLQLAQALNSPRVQAEEFNSLVDAMPNLLRQVERQLGITAGGLKKFVTDGQLSNKLFRDAILGSAAAIDDQFGKANDTIATALTRLNNAFILLVGNFEESTGFFNTTAAVISSLAENMEELARVLKAVAIGFAVAFAPKVIRSVLDMAKAMAVLSATTKTNLIGAAAALIIYIADITGGLDYLMEKLGLVKDVTADVDKAIADLTKKTGGGVAAIQPVVSQPSQEYLTSLENIREFFGNEAANSQFILQALEQYSNYTSQILSDAATGGVDQIKSVSGQVLTFNQAVEESRHVLQLLGLAYEQALGREAGESVDVLALQFLAAQQAMKVLLDLRDQELAVIAEVEARIAAINERGIERTESERIILRYQNEIAEVVADERFSLSQKIEIVKALEAARDRELENAKEVLTYQEMITDELETQLGLSERAASAAVSGVFGAGPNAGRAGSIAQSQSLDEALIKLVFSNEEIAKSIDDVFAELFQLLDPILDKLADLVRLMGRLIDVIDDLVSAVENIPGVQEAAEQAEDAFQKAENWFQDRIDWFTDNGGIFNVPQNTVLGQALGFAGLGNGGGSGGGDQGPSQEEVNAYLETLRASSLKANEMIYEIQLRNLEVSKIEQARLDYVAAANQVTQNETLTAADQIRVIEALIEARKLEIENIIQASKNLADEQIADIERRGASFTKEQELNYLYLQEIASVRENENLVIADQNRVISELEEARKREIENIIKASKALTDAAISDIERRGLVFTEQQEIEYRYAKEIAAAQENTNLTTADQIRLVNALEAARQREIDALERSQYLLDLQSAQSGLAEILRNFEDAIEGIQEIVQGLFDQVAELLFSEFNLMPVMDQFELASDRYAALLEQAFDPNATEEDITNLQAFVNEYLSAARDVYKSSSRFQSIFDQVLQDLTVLGLQYGFTAPVGAVATTRSDVSDLAEELGVSMESLIAELDRLAIEFANQQLEFIGEVLEVDFAEIVDIQFPDSLDLGEITFTYSLADLDLGKIIPVYTLGEIDLGRISPSFTFTQPTINLGTINATASFSTSSFVGSMNTLNTNISNAINSFIATLNSAANAVSSSTTTTPTTTTPTPTPSNPIEALAFSSSTPTSGISGWNSMGTDVLSKHDSAWYRGETTPAYLAKKLLAEVASPKVNYGISFDLGAEDWLVTFNDLQEAQTWYDFYSSYQYATDVIKYGFRQGGLVPDPMDTIPAMLSPGEYILSPETVRRFGVSSLNQLNSGDASAISQTNDPEVKHLLAELIQAVRESDTEVNVYTDMRGQAKAAVEEFRSEIKERSRRQGDQFIPVRYI